MKLSQMYRSALVATTMLILSSGICLRGFAQTNSPQGAMAQDLSNGEQEILTATQGQTAAAVFGATVTTAAWKSKPSWAVIAGNDRAIPPELEKDEAATIKATSITLPSNHLAMLSHPKEVAELIEQAAAKAK